jgi:hypothetical protein
MIVAYGWTDGTQSMDHSSDLDNRARVCLNCGRIHEDRHDMMVICQELVPRGTRPAYFCLLVPRVQATVSHNDKED